MTVATKQAQQSLRVSPELWRRARLKALGAGESMTTVVARLLTVWMDEQNDREGGGMQTQRQLEPPRTSQETGVLGWDPRPPAPAARLKEPRAGIESCPSRQIPDSARCICGVQAKDHRSGGSGRLAIATNCARFREA